MRFIAALNVAQLMLFNRCAAGSHLTSMSGARLAEESPEHACPNQAPEAAGLSAQGIQGWGL